MEVLPNDTLRGFPDKIVLPFLFLSFADFVNRFLADFLLVGMSGNLQEQKPLALEELWPKGFERESSACSQKLRIALSDLQVGASAPHQMKSVAPVPVGVPVGAVPGTVPGAGVPGAVAVAVAVAGPLAATRPLSPWVAMAAAVAAAVGWAVVAASAAAAVAQCAAQSWLFQGLVPATVDAVSFVVAEAPPVAGAALSPVDLRIPS